MDFLIVESSRGIGHRKKKVGLMNPQFIISSKLAY